MWTYSFSSCIINPNCFLPLLMRTVSLNLSLLHDNLVIITGMFIGGFFCGGDDG